MRAFRRRAVLIKMEMRSHETPASPRRNPNVGSERKTDSTSAMLNQAGWSGRSAGGSGWRGDRLNACRVDRLSAMALPQSTDEHRGHLVAGTRQ